MSYKLVMLKSACNIHDIIITHFQPFTDIASPRKFVCHLPNSPLTEKRCFYVGIAANVEDVSVISGYDEQCVTYVGQVHRFLDSALKLQPVSDGVFGVGCVVAVVNSRSWGNKTNVNRQKKSLHTICCKIIIHSRFETSRIWVIWVKISCSNNRKAYIPFVVK